MTACAPHTTGCAPLYFGYLNSLIQGTKLAAKQYVPGGMARLRLVEAKSMDREHDIWLTKITACPTLRVCSGQDLLGSWARGMDYLLHTQGNIIFRSRLSDMSTRVDAGTHCLAADPLSPATLPRHPKYIAILVATSPIQNYGLVSALLYTTVDHPEPIPWSATDTTTCCIPPMLVSLAFRRHFALCLVPESVWESKTTALREKLTGALFWDHGGSTPSSNAAVWPPDRIGKINAIQVLGSVGADEDATARCTASEFPDQHWHALYPLTTWQSTTHSSQTGASIETYGGTTAILHWR
jgi:hypothetical protein